MNAQSHIDDVARSAVENSIYSRDDVNSGKANGFMISALARRLEWRDNKINDLSTQSYKIQKELILLRMRCSQLEIENANLRESLCEMGAV